MTVFAETLRLAFEKQAKTPWRAAMRAGAALAAVGAVGYGIHRRRKKLRDQRGDRLKKLEALDRKIKSRPKHVVAAMPPSRRKQVALANLKVPETPKERRAREVMQKAVAGGDRGLKTVLLPGDVYHGVKVRRASLIKEWLKQKRNRDKVAEKTTARINPMEKFRRAMRGELSVSEQISVLENAEVDFATREDAIRYDKKKKAMLKLLKNRRI